MPKFGMNLLLWTTHVTEKDFATMQAIKKTGYDGVEIPVFEGDAGHYAKVKKTLDDLGLGCTTVTVMSADKDPVSKAPAVRAKALDHLKWAIDMTAALGGDALCGPLHSALGVFSGKSATDDERKRSADVLRKAGEFAQSAGLKLSIEYLNRFENYLLTTADECAAHVVRIDHPGVGMMWDTFHAHIEEKDSPKALKRVAKHVTHVHISENDRGTPGSGQVDWEATWSALGKAKYDGWLTIEAFGRALPDLAAATRVWRDLFGKPQDVYGNGLKFMKKCWSEVAPAKGRA